jgi:hypothetical protein
MPNVAFNYHIGNVNVDYVPNGTSFVHVPPSGAGGNDREFVLPGMLPAANYAVHATSVGCTAATAPMADDFEGVVVADGTGMVRFRAFAHCGVSIVLNH